MPKDLPPTPNFLELDECDTVLMNLTVSLQNAWTEAEHIEKTPRVYGDPENLELLSKLRRIALNVASSIDKVVG